MFGFAGGSGPRAVTGPGPKSTVTVDLGPSALAAGRLGLTGS